MALLPPPAGPAGGGSDRRVLVAAGTPFGAIILWQLPAIGAKPEELGRVDGAHNG